MPGYESHLKDGDIIVTYHRSSAASKLIAYFTTKWGKISKKKACHVHLYLGNGKIVESIDGKGVRIRGTKGYSNKSFDLYICRYQGMSQELIGKLSQAAAHRVGERYAYLQLYILLLKYMFNIKKTKDVSKKAMICSECIAQLFVDSGNPLFEIEPHEVSPAHYLEHDKIEVSKIF